MDGTHYPWFQYEWNLAGKVDYDSGDCRPLIILV